MQTPEIKTKNSNNSLLIKKIVIATVVLAGLVLGAYLFFSGYEKPDASIEPEIDTVVVDENVEPEVEPVPEPVRRQTPVQDRTGIRTKQYPFGRYEGNLVNSIPNGQGTMYYTCRIQIAKHGSKTYYAENGDIFAGTWGNGDIVTGKLFDRNNNQKATILAGKRPNPYDINNDRCE